MTKKRKLPTLGTILKRIDKRIKKKAQAHSSVTVIICRSCKYKDDCDDYDAKNDKVTIHEYPHITDITDCGEYERE